MQGVLGLDDFVRLFLIKVQMGTLIAIKYLCVAWCIKTTVLAISRLDML